MKKLFGTDGMRGVAGRFPLEAETMRTAGHSLARHLAAHDGREPRIVTGRDTRESGAWLEAALIEGARAAGAACESAGVMTTPGVAFLARTLPADAGVVISASHNPYEDNGIKIFAPTGRKLDDTTERLIETDIYEAQGKRVVADERPPNIEAEPAPDSGKMEAASTALRQQYLDYLADEVAGDLRLEELRMVVDCANGAATQLAPALFTRLGADVRAYGVEPDGRNINRECGSLYVERLCEKVVAAGAHLGVAFDGDADRALFVDARGQVVDGDATMWALAQSMTANGQLSGEQVVATV
ncbi:MAG: phosphoglucosamine mutase, partial [Acidobacteriota bacterium]|nr:phosphoglucosamine mutase [Acidobacteriota bacterium]